MSAAARVALAAVASLAVSCAPPPSPPPPPPPPATASAPAPPPVSGLLSEADRARARREQQREELNAWLRAEQRLPVERYRRWQALTGEQDDIAAEARAAMAAIETEARLHHEGVKITAHGDALDGRFGSALRRVESVIAHYDGTQAATGLRETRRRLTDYQERLERATLRERIGIDKNGWNRGGALRVVEAHQVAPRRPAWDLMMFMRPGRSRMVFELQLARVPAAVFLVIKQYATLAGVQYSPYDLLINDTPLLAGTNPVDLHLRHYRAYRIERMLRPGVNRLMLRFCIDARSNYWLYGMLISDVDPSALVPVSRVMSDE